MTGKSTIKAFRQELKPYKVSRTFISTSNTGRWKIYRGDNASGVLIMTVGDGADFPLSQYDIAIANTPTANIFVTNTGIDGTLILQVTKTATYPAGVLTGY